MEAIVVHRGGSLSA